MLTYGGKGRHFELLFASVQWLYLNILLCMLCFCSWRQDCGGDIEIPIMWLANGSQLYHFLSHDVALSAVTSDRLRVLWQTVLFATSKVLDAFCNILVVCCSSNRLSACVRARVCACVRRRETESAKFVTELLLVCCFMYMSSNRLS